MPDFSPWPPVTFAWVDPSETTFGPQHIRFDEDVVDFQIDHTEGNFPTLAVTIANPYEGLVGPGRKYWAWMGYVAPPGYTGTVVNGIAPFFLGRLIATPDNIQNEFITLQFMARSRTWLKLKQHQADLLRDDPYDPILVNINNRADADPVLQFRSAVWHFDRVPTSVHGGTPDLQVGISDILLPEEGFLTFQQEDHFYKAFDWKIGQQPLLTVQMRSDVHWIQAGAGVVSIPSGTVTTWTGGSIVNGWPKAGTGLSGGYTVAGAMAWGNAEFASATQHHFTWENTNNQPDPFKGGAVHSEGDAMTEDATWTTYPVAGELIRYNVFIQPGVVNPFGSPSPVGLGNPPTGVNIPLHVQWSELMVCFWTVFTTLVLEYDVQRPRHEKIQFNLTADLQPVFTDVHEPASVDTETVNMPGADVGLPIINAKSWYTYSLAGQFVQAGSYVESTPEFVGGPLFGIAIIGGFVGSVEPAWTDVLGDQITDGSVVWAMVGATLPTDFPTWRDVSGSSVSAGLVIRSQFYLPPPTDFFGHPLVAPPAGTNAFQVAVNNGTTQIYSNGLNGVADLNPSWPEPRFSTVLGQFTQDNTVTWLSLGTGAENNPVIDIPLGINTGARSYYPKDRGQRTIRALINAARARLRMRARVIKISFECAIERALDMSCRKGVIIFDHRIPGGFAYAKITAYTMLMKATSEGGVPEPVCKVTAEAAPGFIPPEHMTSQPVINEPGTPTYVLPGYVQTGYQQYIGSSNGPVPPANPFPPSASDGSDVGYTRPADTPNDDGITFPITDASQVIVNQQWITGLPPGAPQFVPNAVFSVTSQFINHLTGIVTQVTVLLPVPNGFTPVVVQQQITQQFTGNEITLTTIYYFPVTQYYLELNNLNKPFAQQYFVDTTDLGIEQMVNLQAPASP